MTMIALLPFAAATFSLCVAAISLLPKKRSFARWSFFVGMVMLGIDSLFTGLTGGATELSQVLYGARSGVIISSFVPAAWIAFSVAYSRGDYRQSMARWKVLLAAIALLPIAMAIAFQQDLLEWTPYELAGE